MATRNVVVMPFGTKSLRSDWITNKEGRNFDVVLLYYHNEIPADFNLQSEAYSIFHLKDFKWIMIKNLFTSISPKILSAYDYFFFIDDDIEIELNDINFLFKSVNDCNIEMSQPVLTRRSFKSWRSLRRKLFSGIRFVSSVELMCPLMSVKAVDLLLPTFALNRSGWGIDILWGKIIREKFGNKSIAVFDIIQATHGRPVGKGELYEKLGKPAAAERDEIFKNFDLKETTIYTLNLKENTFFNRLKSYLKFRRLRNEFFNSNQPAL